MNFRFSSVLSHVLFAIMLLTQVGLAWAEGKYAVAGVDDDAVVDTFLADLQRKLTANDRSGMAAMINYPLTVSVSGKKYTLKAPRDFLAHYDRIMNSAVQKAILNTQEPFVKCDGIMLGDHGEIWLNLVAPDFKVLKIGTFNPD